MNPYDKSTGTIPLGGHLEQDGVARWTVYHGGRLLGGAVLGSVGSGRTTVMGQLAHGYRAADCEVWTVDTQRGANVASYADHAWRTAWDTAEIRRMFRGASELCRRRQRDPAGWAARPHIAILVEEAHHVLADPELNQLVRGLDCHGGDVGIALVWSTHQPVGWLPASALRVSPGGNLVFLRSDFGSSWVPPSFGVDPSTFPRIPGYARVVGPDGRAGAPFRTFYASTEVVR